MADHEHNNYVTFRWLFGTALTCIGLGITVNATILKFHLSNPHPQAAEEKDLDDLRDWNRRLSDRIRELEKNG